MEIEQKIYSDWAFTENELEKRDMNYKIYKVDLEHKAKRFYGDEEPTEEERKQFTCYKLIHHGYGHNKYQIISNPHNFSNLELALICDNGNLCFGYQVEGKDIISIYTD